MRNDESLPTAHPPVAHSSSHPGIKLPAFAGTKDTAMPGGVPPMFASQHAQPSEPRGDAMDR